MLASLSLLVIALVSNLSTPHAKTPSRTVKPPVQGCVTCGWNAGCRSCVGGGEGSNCDTSDCSTCSWGGLCNRGGDRPQLNSVTVGPPSNDSSNNLNQQPVNSDPPAFPSSSEIPLRLSSVLIKEIGARHPRFGATLANRNVFGFLPGTRTILWTPTEIVPKDIDAFLNRKAHDEFFRKYNEKAREINLRIQKGEIQEIVYKLYVEQLDPNTWTIKLQLASGTQLPDIDPPYSSLEIRLTYSGASPESANPIKTAWEIR